ncbi:hypothetical protein D7Z26_12140 [Cohnella endophytica]|uniref:Uncharacterized protein n=1 Tax=Cohnella endophytica TaxID=2419778 RepID=A0A494Y130_9BACL|nr:hypothetical protein [Cohnella endophytica]RKP54127.1 hypothetical protein D7Z26_12140 [Cohnella endophytica]
MMHGFALISKKGIEFLDEAYSCRIAVKERWFNIDETNVKLAEVLSVDPFRQQITIRFKGKVVVCNKLLDGIEATMLWFDPLPANTQMIRCKKINKSSHLDKEVQK